MHHTSWLPRSLFSSARQPFMSPKRCVVVVDTATHSLDYSPVDIPRWDSSHTQVAQSFSRREECQHLRRLHQLSQRLDTLQKSFKQFCGISWTWSTMARPKRMDWKQLLGQHSVVLSRDSRHQAIKQLAIPIIEDDVVAFELSKQHAWYEGLCQLTLKHPENSTFDLKPILRENVVRQFVLQWHPDQGKVGHVFRYGEVLPDAEFEDFLAKTPRLEPYRWMQAIKMEKFDAATDLRSSLTAVRRQPRPTHSFPRAWQSSLARFQRNP